MKNEVDIAESGRRLSQALRYSGISRYQLAHISGLAAQQIGEYIDGRKSLADDGHAGLLAEICGVSPRWLLTGDRSKAASAAVAQFLRLPHVHMLTDEDANSMVEFLEMLPGGDELEAPLGEVEQRWTVGADASCDEPGPEFEESEAS